MGKPYQKFLSKHIDLAPLGVERREDNSPYFCTPKGASIFGWAGVDGIHYCFIRGFGEMVFSVSPMEAAPNYVRPLARDFPDFLRLLLACKDANLLEQAWKWSAEQFGEEVETCVSDPAACDTLAQIREKLNLTPMEQPFTYLHELQTQFDSSRIRYTEDFYDPEMNENAPPPAWAVYFEGTIYGHSGSGKPGTEIPVNREFRFAGREFRVPAVYSCAKGLVVDFCMRVNAEEVHRFLEKWQDRYDRHLNQRDRMLCNLENPLHFEFEPQLIVNGKPLRRRNGSGVCFLPGDPSESETRLIAEHYHLNQSDAWSFSRICFPWSSGRRPKIRSLELTMHQEPVEIPGEVFEVCQPGEQVELSLHGHPFTLTVADLEPQILDASMLASEELDYPACFTALSYTLSPDPAPAVVRLQDLAECDQPRPKTTESSLYGSYEAAAIAIIGGADGPTAICVGAPETEHTRSACSAPHFEPAAHIQWFPVLSVTEYGPVSVSLI